MTGAGSKIGFLGAGEMGAALAGHFAGAGAQTFTVSVGRSAESQARIAEAGMTGVADLQTLVDTCDVLFSVLPPEVAEDEAIACAEMVRSRKTGLVFVEANAISPERKRRIETAFGDTDTVFVDAGIIGSPPRGGTRPRLYVSGPRVDVLDALDGCGYDLVRLGSEIGQAAAMKMVYAAMTKGSNALLTAGYLAAEQHQLLDVFLQELSTSQPALHRRAEANITRLPADAARWIFEMQEIASTLRAVGLPGGFHDGAAEIMALLAQSEFGSETRRTRDASRSATDTIRTVAKNL